MSPIRRQTLATCRRECLCVPAHFHLSKYNSGLGELSFLEEQLAGWAGQTGAPINRRGGAEKHLQKTFRSHLAESRNVFARVPPQVEQEEEALRGIVSSYLVNPRATRLPTHIHQRFLPLFSELLPLGFLTAIGGAAEPNSADTAKRGSALQATQWLDRSGAIAAARGNGCRHPSYCTECPHLPLCHLLARGRTEIYAEQTAPVSAYVIRLARYSAWRYRCC